MKRTVDLGLRENLGQFTLLIVVNAFVGGMVGLERSILPQIAEAEFHIAAKTALLSFIVVFGIVKGLTNYTRAESDWKNGSPYRYVGSDGASLVDGMVIESVPMKKLVTTFNPHWDPSLEGKTAESRVTFEIEQLGGACKLTLVHDDLIAGDPLTEGVFRGWSEILSGLKTLLETGKPLAITPKA